MALQEPIEQRADVVIIGGGIAGCASAYYLAKRGVKVVLVEKNSRVAFEQSGRAWGFVRQQGRDPREIPLMMAGIKLWERLEAELGADVEWVQGGNLRLAPDERVLARQEETVREERAMGLDVRLLTRQEVQALVPGMEGDFVGGMYCPNDGHAEPVKATMAFARAAEELGAVIYTRCAAEGIERAGGRAIAVVTERGEVKAPVVVCAAGAWSSKVARLAGLNLPQRKVRSTVAATEPVPPITPMGVWGAGLAFRQKKDGSVYIAGGGGADYDIGSEIIESFRNLWLFFPNYRKNWRLFRLHLSAELLRDIARRMPWSKARKHPFAHTVDVEPEPNRERVERSRAAFLRAFPFLEHVRIERSWAGYIDSTPDAVPVLGEAPGLQGFVFATGFSGHGFAMGPIVGKLVAELIVGGQPSLDLSGLRLSRFFDGTMAAPRELM